MCCGCPLKSTHACSHTALNTCPANLLTLSARPLDSVPDGILVKILSLAYRDQAVTLRASRGEGQVTVGTPYPNSTLVSKRFCRMLRKVPLRALHVKLYSEASQLNTLLSQIRMPVQIIDWSDLSRDSDWTSLETFLTNYSWPDQIQTVRISHRYCAWGNSLDSPCDCLASTFNIVWSAFPSCRLVVTQ